MRKKKFLGSNMISVSVVIPVYGAADRQKVTSCVQSILEQSVPSDIFEVIVVDNGPFESNIELCLPDRVVVVRESAAGSFAARNSGVKVARGNIIVFTDADCIPDSRWLERIVEYFSANTNAGCAGGAICVTTQFSVPTLVESHDLLFAFTQYKILDGRPYAYTANMIVRREVFDDVGLFNARLLSGGDIEWGVRAKSKGYIISYLPEAIVFHPARKSIQELIKKAVRTAGGDFEREGRFWVRLSVILVGLIPPLTRFQDMRKPLPLCVSKMFAAFGILYLLRIVRSITFVFLFFRMTSPVRA